MPHAKTRGIDTAEAEEMQGVFKVVTHKDAKGGDTPSVMQSAAHVVEGAFHRQRQPHPTMEPGVGLAYFDAEGRPRHRPRGPAAPEPQARRDSAGHGRHR